MYDVGAIRLAALKAYQAAPNPVTFLALVAGAKRALAEQRDLYNALPSAVQSSHKSWAIRASAYAARLDVEGSRAREIADAVKSGSLDWSAGLLKGSDYAKALDKFFQGGDSAAWAKLGNEMATFKDPQRPTFDRPWLLELWMPWTAGQNLVIEEMAEAVSTTELAERADAAVKRYIPNPKKFLKTARMGILAAVAAVGVLFAWDRWG